MFSILERKGLMSKEESLEEINKLRRDEGVSPAKTFFLHYAAVASPGNREVPST
jgi:hypothetical protein